MKSAQEGSGIEVPVDCMAVLRWVEGDHDLLTELIGIFIEDCPRRLHELQQAVKAGDATRIRQAAHSLKGMVAGFNTSSAQRLADEMENLGKAANLSKISDLLPKLLLEFDRVMHYLKVVDWRGMNSQETAR